MVRAAILSALACVALAACARPAWDYPDVVLVRDGAVLDVGPGLDAGPFDGAIAPRDVPALPDAACFPVELCNGADDDCDTRTDEGFDFETNPNHCGGCNMPCGAMEECVDRDCVMGDGGPGPLPDLVITDLMRGGGFYTIRYCNYGGRVGSGTFLFALRNMATSTTYTSDTRYPYNIPPVGLCDTTPGFNCALIDDAGCTGTGITVRATIDPTNTVVEIADGNNDFDRAF